MVKDPTGLGDRETALAMVAEKVSKKMAENLKTFGDTQPFGSGLGDLAATSAYLPLWTRDGLTKRERSLVTIAMLVALRAQEELKAHTTFGIENGCSVRDLEEVVYQATAYAGFPAANAARAVLQAHLMDLGAIARK